MDHNLYRCAVCLHGEIRPWFRTAFGRIGRCSACGQVLRADTPDRQGHVVLHQSSELHKSAYAERSRLGCDDLSFYSRFLDLCASADSGGAVLDVGSGGGAFLALTAAHGLQAVGIEPVAELRAEAQQQVSASRITSQPVEEAEFEPGSFVGVALWDVIEHLVDPRGVLERVREFLRPNGYLGIATLNHRCLLYGAYHLMRFTAPFLARRFGPLLYNPFHTYYFTMESLARLVRNTGFQIVEHENFEFPLKHLSVGPTVKAGVALIYALQAATKLRGEQYLFARKR